MKGVLGVCTHLDAHNNWANLRDRGEPNKRICKSWTAEIALRDSQEKLVIVKLLCIAFQILWCSAGMYRSCQTVQSQSNLSESSVPEHSRPGESLFLVRTRKHRWQNCRDTIVINAYRSELNSFWIFRWEALLTRWSMRTLAGTGSKSVSNQLLIINLGITRSYRYWQTERLFRFRVEQRGLFPFPHQSICQILSQYVLFSFRL